MRSLHLLPPALLISITSWAQNSPIHHWPLDDGSGLQAVDIAGGAHGILQNGATWQPGGGHFGGALQFDGADDRVDLGPCDITTGTGDQLTICLWMKAGLMTGSEQVLLSKTTGPNASDYVWSLSQVNSTAIRFRVQGAGSVAVLTTSGSSLFSGAWYHIAGVYDGAEMRIYINGALMTSVVKSGSFPFAPQAPATMGGRVDGNDQFLGMLDDVRIYDQALSYNEVVNVVISGVATEVHENDAISMTDDGHLLLPQGDWQSIRVFDTSGRILYEHGLRAGDEAPVLPIRTCGPVMVCLLGRERVVVKPLVIP